MVTPTIEQPRVVVVVFTMNGCPACADYKPRFARIAAAYQNQVPIVMADVEDPQYKALADRLNVVPVPATFALRRPCGMIRMEGAVPDEQIAWLLGVAAREAAAGY